MEFEKKLIEGNFPCRQVGAETRRERSTGLAPAPNRLHVWWARRPLTPSRAAVLGSLLSEDTTPGEFLIELGLRNFVINVNGESLNLPAAFVQQHGMSFTYTRQLSRVIADENRVRTTLREIYDQLTAENPDLANNPVVQEMRGRSKHIDVQGLNAHDTFHVRTVAANPAWFNDLMAICGEYGIRVPNLYGYDRGYKSNPTKTYPGYTVLDPTAGGGSIPFEALRLGCDIVANDINPVATVIEHATIKYPREYGSGLQALISTYGTLLVDAVSEKMSTYYGQSVNANEKDTSYLYYREVTCPHCGERAPLLNAFALQKKADGWAVRPEIVIDGAHKHVRFIPYRLANGRGPNGEDVTQGTVKSGTGTCLFCGQAIESDEIKRQARGESEHGTWKDVLYCVVGKREQPKLDRDGRVRRYASGPNRGEVVTETVTFFREPVQNDFDALERAEKVLGDNWDRWDAMGLIPTERIPEGHKTAELRNVGNERWCDMFTPRQLLAALTAMETLHDMAPTILEHQGADKGRAIITYLQFMVDKFYDYNSRQTRWHYTHCNMVGTFGRHDFSLKWTFGEMIASGPYSGLDWGRSQVLDAYRGICELLPERRSNAVKILNGSAANLELEASSVDIICVDPPYYNNVQYAELSDFYYVWDKRTLRDLYPGVFGRRLTNKNDEAVANPVRDGSVAESNERYETLMGEIFKECRRVMKDDGIMVMMFTHKTQAAWETLTRALIENGWIISSTFPVDSESGASMHQRDQAAAASSIFISCRKRDLDEREPAVWEGFGGGVINDVRAAVGEGLASYEPLRLNAVDEMVASYGCALRVLSENWPVIDGDELVSPITAMREASMAVAQYQMTRLTGGRLGVNDVDAETSVALTLFGVYGLEPFPYDDALSLSKSLNIRLDNQTGGYRSDGRSIGIAPERATRGHRSEQTTIFYAPLVSRGSKLRIAKPEERNTRRLDNPQSEWDIAQGTIQAYRSGDIPVARAYLNRHAVGSERKVLDILNVLADGMDGEGKKEIRRLLYGLR